ncbi:hypothetical protein L249_8658 [Ophiocordyceps polyrhachis-furcata BCC 54312]|uniref:DNA-binding protein RAP1 n=1 Tax=Ophiocordyceps polyrhachis-furcata BCC 54312 TaxID=1330021 RepID=A0A367L7B4_9HYPO|nr:hypothetical protein L249_8658 [Ophiocordyceps polyrhachis-furcata BCC 54312]
MSHITYDGVVAGPQGGGNIFQGMRFWVALRNNGGTLEMLEKKADFLIADDARKDAPTGSYSWKMIADSVENGIMQLPDRYSIDMMQGRSGPAVSAGPTKRSRTPFTHADDVILAAWIVNKGGSLQGNNIYQELEKLAPQHTWQSWRNRYTKSLSNMGWDYVVKLAGEELPDETEGPSKTTAAPNKVVSPSATPNREDGKASNGSEGETHPETSEDDKPISDAGNFYNDLGAFYEDGDIPIQHLIGGKVVELWNLRNAICKQGCPAEEVDWRRVAKDLDDDWDYDEQTCVGLRECFEKYLADFIEVMRECASTKDVGKADQPEVQERNADERSRSIPRSLPSSPPRTPRKKRSQDGDAAESGRRAKRSRRVPRDIEIPSTPEEKTGVSMLLPAAADASYANEQLPSLYCAGPEDEECPSPTQQLLSETTAACGVAEEEPAEEATPRRRSPRSLGGNAAGPPRANAQASRQTLPSSLGSSSAKASGRIRERQKQQRRSAAGSAATGGEPGITEHIQHYISLGYSERNVIEALKSTSLRPGGAASHVMQSLKEGKGIPTNVEGAWTGRDDRDLLWADEVKARRGPSASGAEVKKATDKHNRLDHKHGAENLKLRRRFIADLARATEQQPRTAP